MEKRPVSGGGGGSSSTSTDSESRAPAHDELDGSVVDWEDDDLDYDGPEKTETVREGNSDKDDDGYLEKAKNAGEEVVETTKDVAGDAANEVSEKFDGVQETADEELREATGGRIGVSQDFTSTEDSGGVDNVANEATDEVQNKVDNFKESTREKFDDVQETADEKLREATGGRIGVSDDFTSREDSGGIRNVADKATEPVQEKGREFRQKREEEGEQFGDVDLTLGLGGEGDDIEQAAERFQSGVRNRAADAGNYLMDPDNSGRSLGEFVLTETGNEELGQQYDSALRDFGRGVVTGSGAVVGSAPKFGVEAAETTIYTLTNPRDTAAKSTGATSAAAVETVEGFQENPAQATGNLVGGVALGIGASRAASGLRRSGDRSSSTSRTQSKSGPTSGPNQPRLLTSDRNRGQLIFGRRDGDRDGSGQSGSKTGQSSRDGGGSGVLPDNIDEMLNRMENADTSRAGSRRDANRRAEEKIIEKRLEEGRRQERGDEPRSVTRDREPDTVTRDREPDTVSRELDTSEPTGSGWWRSNDSSSGVDLSPREKRLAAKLGRQTPSGDLRALDATRRQTPETDLRTQFDVSGSSRGGGVPSVSGAAASDPIKEMADLQSQAEASSLDDSDVNFGEIEIFGPAVDSDSGDSNQISKREPPELPVNPEPDIAPPGTDTDSRGDSDSDSDSRSDSDQLPDTGGRIGTTPDSDTGTDSREDARPGTDTDTIMPVPPKVDTPPETGTRTPPGRDDGLPPGQDPTPPGGGRPPGRGIGGGGRDGGGRSRPRRIPTPNLTLDAGNDDDDGDFWNEAAEGYTVDFIDPLSGETLETEEDENSGIPGLGM